MLFENVSLLKSNVDRTQSKQITIDSDLHKTTLDNFSEDID